VNVYEYPLPKFKLGQRVWAIYGFKAAEFEVCGIEISVQLKDIPVDHPPGLQLTRRCCYRAFPMPRSKNPRQDSASHFEEQYLFTSKEELIENL
jgi:hypothetical protein